MLLHDDTPIRRVAFPFVTWGLIGLTAIFFLAEMGNVPLAQRLGFQPAEWLSAPFGTHALMGLLTHTLVHEGWLHLFGNMLMLFVLADNVEDALGHLRFILFYALCAVAAAVTHALLGPNPTDLLVGASGAVAGVMAAYLLLYPRARLLCLVFLRLPVLLPASWFVGGWIGMNVLRAVTQSDREVAWFAHIGGFVAGLVLVLVMRPAGVALFQPATLAEPAEGAGWLQRMTFDFAPKPPPSDPENRYGDDDPIAALWKAALFLVLLLLGGVV